MISNEFNTAEHEHANIAFTPNYPAEYATVLLWTLPLPPKPVVQTSNISHANCLLFFVRLFNRNNKLLLLITTYLKSRCTASLKLSRECDDVDATASAPLILEVFVVLAVEGQ